MKACLQNYWLTTPSNKFSWIQKRRIQCFSDIPATHGVHQLFAFVVVTFNCALISERTIDRMLGYNRQIIIGSIVIRNTMTVYKSKHNIHWIRIRKKRKSIPRKYTESEHLNCGGCLNADSRLLFARRKPITNTRCQSVRYIMSCHFNFIVSA